jgi:hypothetical protein
MYEACVPGGPGCQGLADSTANDLACITQTINGRTFSECLQPCRQNSDCVRRNTHCGHVPNQGYACFGNYGCTNYFVSCDSDAVGDGTCLPVVTSSGIRGLCYQADLDAGLACSSVANRQNGGFCQVGQDCYGGLCRQVCNAGISGPPGCSGPGESCLPLGPTTDPSDTGICALQCDFTDLDGGGCPSTSGIPEKCLPEYLDSLTDSAKGFCVRESTAPLALGQTCEGPDPTIPDPCGPDLACASEHGGSVVSCVQLCNGIGGQSNCSTGQTCDPWHVDGVPSAYVGICF